MRERDPERRLLPKQYEYETNRIGGAMQRRFWGTTVLGGFTLNLIIKGQMYETYLMLRQGGLTEEEYRQRLAELRREFGPDHAVGWCRLWARLTRGFKRRAVSNSSS